jgi:sulfonate transport system substrate-binding protein
MSPGRTKYLNQALADLNLQHYWPSYDARGNKLTDGEVEQTRAAGE